MSTPLLKQSATELTSRLKSINDEIRQMITDNICKYESAILNCHCEIPNNIYTHIYTILSDFINRKLTTNRDEYYYLMKCGSILLTDFIKLESTIGSKILLHPNTTSKDSLSHDNLRLGGTASQGNQNKTIHKTIVALYYLNYIRRKLLPYAYKQKYMCDLDDYIAMYYSDMITNYKSAILQIYGNQKKILYVKKYPYNIDSKIFCTLIEYFVNMDYVIDDIPASYIIKDTILTDNELALFEVTQREVDILFGYNTMTYSNMDMTAINNMVDEDIDDIQSIAIVDDLEPYEQGNGQQPNDEEQDEEDDYSYNDDFE
jgi:hypothetical protein